MDKKRFEQVFSQLTKRRKEVLLKFLETKTDSEIAKFLNVAKSTVRKHIEEICKIFGFENDFVDERRSKRQDLYALFAKFKPELLDVSTYNYSENNLATLVQDSRLFLESIEIQHGLLVERAQEIYSFSHLTFQEYFTAKKIKTLIDNYDSTIIKYIKNFSDERWREVFSLASVISFRHLCLLNSSFVFFVSLWFIPLIFPSVSLW